MREDLSKYQDLVGKITSVESFKAEPLGLSFVSDFAYRGNYENMVQIMHGIVAADSVIGTNTSKLTIDDIFGTADVSEDVKQNLARSATGGTLLKFVKSEKAKRVHFLRLFTDACLIAIKKADKSGKFEDIKFVAEASAKVYNVCFKSSMQYRENLDEDEIWAILYDMYGRAMKIAGFVEDNGTSDDKNAEDAVDFWNDEAKVTARKVVALITEFKKAAKQQYDIPFNHIATPQTFQVLANKKAVLLNVPKCGDVELDTALSSIEVLGTDFKCLKIYGNDSARLMQDWYLSCVNLIVKEAYKVVVAASKENGVGAMKVANTLYDNMKGSFPIGTVVFDNDSNLINLNIDSKENSKYPILYRRLFTKQKQDIGTCVSACIVLIRAYGAKKAMDMTQYQQFNNLLVAKFG